MQCIMNATACAHNHAGQCRDKPQPENLGCLGIVCWNIKPSKPCPACGEVVGYDPSNGWTCTNPVCEWMEQFEED